MTLTIPDEVVKQSGLTEQELLVELACRLYDLEKLTKTQASRLVGLTRDEFNAELITRGLPVIRYHEEDIERELKAVRGLDNGGSWKENA